MQGMSSVVIHGIPKLCDAIVTVESIENAQMRKTRVSQSIAIDDVECSNVSQDLAPRFRVLG